MKEFLIDVGAYTLRFMGIRHLLIGVFTLDAREFGVGILVLLAGIAGAMWYETLEERKAEEEEARPPVTPMRRRGPGSRSPSSRRATRTG